MNRAEPNRGDIWWANLDPVIGREQAGQRPVLVVSVDKFNHGPAGLAVVLPVTSHNKRQPMHVEIEPPEGGLNSASYVKCEDIRSVSKERFTRFAGRVSTRTVDQVEDRLRILLAL